MATFPPSTLKAIDGIKYFRIRAGDDHRFINIWVVTTDGRVFVRPWNDKADGWYREFLSSKRGAVEVKGKTVEVRAARRSAERLLNAIDAAYAAKYTTKPNQKYVKGFATRRRRATTLELLPA